MKQIWIALMILLLGTVVSAADAPTMSSIGFEIGASKMKADTGYGLIPDVQGQDIEYGVKLGAENETGRATVLVNFFNNKQDDQEYKTGTLLLDYFIPVSASIWWFKPYVGIHGGYMTYSSTGMESDGALFGAQGGFVVRLAESFNFDIGYRYSATQAPYTKKIETIQFGFNYLFKIN